MKDLSQPREVKLQKVRTLVIDEVKVKGPGISNSDMVIYKTSAKKALPFDDEGDEGYTRVTEDMKTKKSSIQTDIDKLSTESRENDGKLLDDISNRLIYRKFVPGMRPIYVNPLALKNRTAVNHWQREIDFASPLLKRAGSHSPASRRKRIIVDTYNLPDEEEIPITEYHHRPRTAIKTEYYHRPKSLYMRAGSVPRMQSTYIRAGSLPPMRSNALSSEVAVRNAKRNLDRIERELGVIVGENETLESTGQTAKTFSYQRNGLPMIKSHTKLGHQANDDYLFEDDYNDYSSSNMASLRSKTVETKSKMDHHRNLIDRYLPVDMAPNPEVKYEIEDKYNQLASRMPDLDSYNIHHDPFEQPQPTVKPYSPALRPVDDPKDVEERSKHYLGRPPVSDVRKNCRSVLCKSHDDPRWYSY